MNHLCILDPSLRDLRGHHYEYNRAVINEARHRGIAVSLYAHRDVTKDIQSELGATPHFARDIYASSLPSGRPAGGRVTRWMEPLICNRAFARDLARLPSMDDRTLVFAHSIQHRQAYALARWQQRGTCRLNLLLRYPTDARNRKYSATDFYYRLALNALDRQRARISTDTGRLAEAYRVIGNIDVDILPIPHIPMAAPEPRTPEPPYRLLQIGHTSTNKGAGLIAALVDDLLELPVRLRFQVSSETYGDAQFIDHDLPRLMQSPAVHRLSGNLNSSDYYREMQYADVVLAVYDPSVYRGASSGVFAEAVAMEKPVITSPDSWMADEINTGHAAGIILKDYSVESLRNSLTQYVNEAADLAVKARQCSASWREHHQISRFMDSLLFNHNKP